MLIGLSLVIHGVKSLTRERTLSMEIIVAAAIDRSRSGFDYFGGTPRVVIPGGHYL